ncbi:MAG: alanine--tRNA ligase [Dehalococcoidales bacterium]|nr:alanine--tRNA ligase [Dehalococcoidales bacterium]MDD4794133.1 alanine--tRNA ligase [Dehalococcoidales bacterium]MDD5498729.1 alanine--tRNA ligase [Dehalococcoidales bacterium]
MTGEELRQAFLSFFENKKHLVMPSSSLVPHNDPTLLLNTAGMVQFKPYFLGEDTPVSRRLTSCQKCFRTTDIESVGDTSHCTFFEMLGNFSIGDYFKSEAIDYGWEFVTEVLKLPSEKLWITIYEDDDEAFELWRLKEVPADRIVRLGEKDNFWGPPGDAGPCGPCSEIHYDYGDDHGCRQPGCNPGCGCSRFVEIWNLVFIQFNQDKKGVRKPLEKPSIDTGMGLERITAVVDGKSTIFETDLLKPLVGEVSVLAGRAYGQNEDADIATRVVAEHGRGITFLIADGVMPGSDGRGYVLRRLIRRAALYGRRLGLKDPFLAQIASATIKLMGSRYPELEEKKKLILDIINAEERRFSETLSAGIELLDKMIETALSESRILAGKDIFKLYDTFGFPVELTREIAQRKGLNTDMAGFENEMSAQRERAKASHRFGKGRTVQEEKLDLGTTCFAGYQKLALDTSISSIVIDGRIADSLHEGQEASLVLKDTPFYAEKGGQVGDSGLITGQDSQFIVDDTNPGPNGSIIHHGKVTQGAFKTGEAVNARVDECRRADIARNHTATHLLHNALRKVIGSHAEQKGSLVSPDRLRFDFSHLKALTSDELEKIEMIVNQAIRSNLPVSAEEMPLKQAIESGAIAIFDEKYSEKVRVLRVGNPPVSAELCGGTHVSATGEIGVFHITSESSVGAGLRRIEAVTGRSAEELLRVQSRLLEELSRALDASAKELPGKVRGLFEECTTLTKQIEDMKRQHTLMRAEELLSRAENIGAVRLVSARMDEAGIELLRDSADYIKDKLGSGIVILASNAGEKPVFVVGVTGDLVKQGYNASNIIRSITRVAGGGGGGKPGLATGGGKDKNLVEQALQAARDFIGQV